MINTLDALYSSSTSVSSGCEQLWIMRDKRSSYGRCYLIFRGSASSLCQHANAVGAIKNLDLEFVSLLTISFAPFTS